MGNSFVGTPPVRKAFGVRMANSLKLSFPAHFRNTEKNISRNFYSFSLTVRLLKMYIFLLLNVLSIPINGDISRTNFGYLTGNFIFKTAYDSPCIQHRPFSFSLTVDHIEIYRFAHQNCLRLPMHTD